MSYTPGPWNLHRTYSNKKHVIRHEDGSENFSYWRLCVGPGDGIVAQIDGDTTVTGWWCPDNGAEVEANARLIAAAPEMVEALAEAVRQYGEGGGPWNVPSDPGGWLEMARAALEKAGVEL
jgi:hypothetical protein